ncbi:FAD synthase [Candidatus Parcubacteria bacterium]|jgi:FAD synthetase|nr:MAG: FAD synthase [Candidatus Parcubacteria bacterium]
MKKIVVTGTFDHLHPGHLFLFKKAKALGDYLTVVVARDKTVKKVKGKLPWQPERFRLKMVKRVKWVDRAVLGKLAKDKLKIIKELKPDILALGYDQRAFTQNLRRELKKRKLLTRVVRLPAFQPKKYKSRLLKRLAKKQKA